ncbi:MAG: hypothetical protein AAF725_22980 [Acidobacteriota bacterium]
MTTDNRRALFSRPIVGGPEVRLDEPSLAGSNEALSEIAFPPSGNSVFYTVRAENLQTLLIRVPVAGGPPSIQCADLGVISNASDFIFAPDGTRILYVCPVEGVSQLVSRDLETGEVTPLVETPVARAKVDPSSRFVFFQDSGRIFRVPLEGGEVQAMSPQMEEPFFLGTRWKVSDDGEAVFFRTDGLDGTRTHLYLGRQFDGVFYDDFESGGTERWTASQP